MTITAFEGYHRFRLSDSDSEFGSFEVFYSSDFECDRDGTHIGGWYWWPCFPGCLPDGEASGPFDTAKLAYEDAQGD